MQLQVSLVRELLITSLKTQVHHSYLSYSMFCNNPFLSLASVLQESYPSTPPIWFVDSDDPSLTQVLERLDDVRKGSTLVSFQTK